MTTTENNTTPVEHDRGQDHTSADEIARASLCHSYSLLMRAEVIDRIATLNEEVAAKLKISKESLVIMLLEDREIAHRVQQPAAAIAAVKAISELLGLDAPQRSEITYRWENLSQDVIAFEFATLLAEARAAAGVPAPKLIEGEKTKNGAS